MWSEDRRGRVRAIVIESLLYNHHDAYSLNVTREFCVRGQRMTPGWSLETESRLCLLPPWKATHPLVALRTGPASHWRRCLSSSVRANAAQITVCSFSPRRCRPLAKAAGPVLRHSVKPAFKKISIVSLQQCSSAGWTSSSFLEETQY